MTPEKIDFLYKIVSNAGAIAQELVTALCLIMLCRSFVKDKRAALLAGASYFPVMVVLYYIPFEMPGFTAHNGGLILAFIIFALIDRRNIRMKIFLLVTFCVARWAVYSASANICLAISGMIQRMMSGRLAVNAPENWKYFYAEYIALEIADLAVSSVMMYFIVRVFSRVLSYRHEEFELRELMFMLIPSVSGLLVYGIDIIYLDAYELGTDIPLYQSRPYIYLLQMLCRIAILATIITAIVFYQKIRKHRDEENARLLLDGQVKELQSHIEEVEKLYSDIRGVKHDIKNHVEVINNLLAQGKNQEAREYARSLSETTEVFDFSVKTGNPVTDVIIHEKIGRAESKEIAFVADFHYPTGMGIGAFDVSVVLSNALSNAIEAAGHGGYIKISSFRNMNAYLIITENSFDGILRIDKESGLPFTIKNDKASHGYGLRNMKAIASKYNGDVQIEQKGNMVVLTVMFIAADQ